MRAYLKGALIGSFFIFLGLSGIYWADQKGYFLLQDLEFQAQSSKDFSETLAYQSLQIHLEKQLEIYKGKSLLSINMKAMTKSLSEHAWLDNVYIKRSFPGRLQITVKPKRWVAYLRESQKYYPITNAGDILPSLDVLDGPDLPIVSVSIKDWKSGLNKKIIEIIEAMPDTGLINIKTLQEVKSDKEGIYIVVAPSNAMIRLGNEEMVLRLARSEKVLEYLHQRNLQGRVINSNFAQKVVVKLHKPR